VFAERDLQATSEAGSENKTMPNTLESAYDKYTDLAASAESTAMLPSLTERELLILFATMPEYSRGIISPLHMDERNSALRIRADYFPRTYLRDGWQTLPGASLRAKAASFSDHEVNLLFAKVMWWIDQPPASRSQLISTHFKIAKDSSVKSGGSLHPDDWNSSISLFSWSLKDAKKLCHLYSYLLETLFAYLGKEELTFVMCRITDHMLKLQAASGGHWTKGFKLIADKGADYPDARCPKKIFSDYSPEALGPGMCFKYTICYLDHTDEEIHQMEFWDLFRQGDEGREIMLDSYVAAYALLGAMVKGRHTALSDKAMLQLVKQLVD
jgi:hypothetical protein